MKRIIKLVLCLIIVIMSMCFFACNKKTSEIVNNNQNEMKKSETEGNETKESETEENKVKDIDNDKYKKYEFGSYIMDVPKSFEENSKTPDSTIFLIEKIPIIMNKIVLNDDYTDEKVEKMINDLIESFNKRFNLIVSKKIEAISFNSTSGTICKIVGQILGDEYIHETYMLTDDADKTIYVFTIFCENNGSNLNYINQFEDMLYSLRKK